MLAPVTSLHALTKPTLLSALSFSIPYALADDYSHRRSIRVTNNDQVLIVGGEGISVGQETDTNKLYRKLEEWTRKHFEVEEVLSYYSAMDYYSEVLPSPSTLQRLP